MDVLGSPINFIQDLLENKSTTHITRKNNSLINHNQNT